MGIFDAHIDARLPALAAGQLGPRRFRALLRHAKTCHRCGTLYQRSISVLRQLEHGSPFEPAAAELEALTGYNEGAVLGLDRLPRTRGGWLALAVVASTVAAASVIAVIQVRQQGGELSARGGEPAGAATVRVFCAGNALPMRELKADAGCEVGRSLLLAAGARAPLEKLAVRVTGSAVTEVETSEAVTGPPGAEAAVALTVPLEREGSVELVVAFAPTEAEALGALRGSTAPHATLVRRTVVVKP